MKTVKRSAVSIFNGGSSRRQKRIPHADASPCNVSRISGHHRQAVGQCDDKALAAFSTAYADRNEKDHAALARAIRKGSVKAVFEEER